MRGVGDMRKIVGDNIFYALYVLNFKIKFLKEDLTNESGLGILLKHEVS